jgi:hypothetical protein
MKESTSPSKQPNLILGMFVLIIASAFLIYSMLPSFLMKVDYHQSKGIVKSINDNHLEYSYYNEFEDQEYTVSRYLSVPQYNVLSKVKTFEVLYPNHFPEDAIIVNIDKEKPIALFVLLIVFLFYGLFKILQRLYDRLKPLKSIDASRT